MFPSASLQNGELSCKLRFSLPVAGQDRPVFSSFLLPQASSDAGCRLSSPARCLFPAFSLRLRFLFLPLRVVQSGSGFRSCRAFWGNPRMDDVRRPFVSFAEQRSTYRLFLLTFRPTHDLRRFFTILMMSVLFGPAAGNIRKFRQRSNVDADSVSSSQKAHVWDARLRNRA